MQRMNCILVTEGKRRDGGAWWPQTFHGAHRARYHANAEMNSLANRFLLRFPRLSAIGTATPTTIAMSATTSNGTQRCSAFRSASFTDYVPAQC